MTREGDKQSKRYGYARLVGTSGGLQNYRLGDNVVEPKNLDYCGSAKKDLLKFPEEVREVVAYALLLAQEGDKHPGAKVMKGFNGATMLELVERHHGDTYRAVYTVRFPKTVYVLHCFQKKSHQGIKTPQHDINLIKERLQEAAARERKLQ